MPNSNCKVAWYLLRLSTAFFAEASIFSNGSCCSAKSPRTTFAAPTTLATLLMLSAYLGIGCPILSNRLTIFGSDIDFQNFICSSPARTTSRKSFSVAVAKFPASISASANDCLRLVCIAPKFAEMSAPTASNLFANSM